jgi:hypothetical protein
VRGTSPSTTDDATRWFFPRPSHRVPRLLGSELAAQRLVLGGEELAVPDEIHSFELYSAQNGVLAFSPNDDGTFLRGSVDR